MPNHYHKWSIGAYEDTCKVCGIKRRNKPISINTGASLMGYIVTEYFVNNKWDSHNNKENKFCTTINSK